MDQFLSALAILGHSERFSPGKIRSEVGRPEGLWLTTGRPTSERITPGEILSEWPEITTPVWFWPKFLENHTPVNPQKFSRGLELEVSMVNVWSYYVMSIKMMLTTLEFPFYVREGVTFLN